VLPEMDHEPAGVYLNLSEGIIHLQGDRPLAEREILLHSSETATVPPMEARAEIPLQAEPTAELDAPLPQSAEIPYWQSQPEQQHQARDWAAEAASGDEPVPPRAAGGGGGNVPPVGPPERGSSMPYPEDPAERSFGPPYARSVEVPVPPEPAAMYRAYVERQVAAQQLPEDLVTRQEMNETVRHASRAAQARALITGLFIEHFNHRRIEKKTAKRFKAQEKQANQAAKRYEVGLQEQAQDQVNIETRLQTTERRAQASEQRLQTAEQRLEAERHERQADQQRRLQTERIRQAERGGQPAEAAVVAAGAEQLVVPPEHKLQNSAWHSIELGPDGNVVENPAFQYGHEYYHERAQENMPPTQRNAAAGEVALVAAAGGSNGGSQASSPSGAGTPLSSTIPNASAQGAPAAVHGDAADTSGRSPSQPDPQTPAAPIWPWVVALAVIAVCLIIALG
jgi:hypothetical protein